MTLPAARELSRSGVRVNVLAPGVMSTPMMEAMPDSVKVELAARVPFPKALGKADWYARLAEEVVLNPYINGEVIRVDGALRMS